MEMPDLAEETNDFSLSKKGEIQFSVCGLCNSPKSLGNADQLHCWNLMQHVYTHMVQRAMTCSECGYQAHRSQGMAVHVRRHQNRKAVVVLYHSNLKAYMEELKDVAKKCFPNYFDRFKSHFMNLEEAMKTGSCSMSTASRPSTERKSGLGIDDHLFASLGLDFGKEKLDDEDNVGALLGFHMPKGELVADAAAAPNFRDDSTNMDFPDDGINNSTWARLFRGIFDSPHKQKTAASNGDIKSRPPLFLKQGVVKQEPVTSAGDKTKKDGFAQALMDSEGEKESFIGKNRPPLQIRPIHGNKPEISKKILPSNLPAVNPLKRALDVANEEVAVLKRKVCEHTTTISELYTMLGEKELQMRRLKSERDAAVYKSSGPRKQDPPAS